MLRTRHRNMSPEGGRDRDRDRDRDSGRASESSGRSRKRLAPNDRDRDRSRASESSGCSRKRSAPNALRMETAYQSPRATAQRFWLYRGDVITTINVTDSTSKPGSSSVSESPAGEASYGSVCTVMANHFLVSSDKFRAHEYHVLFSHLDIASKKNLCRKIISQVVNDNQEYLNGQTLAYDGMDKAYTERRLPFVSRDFDVQFSWREMDVVTVTIAYSSTLELRHIRNIVRGKRENAPPQQTIHALDVVLRHTPTATYKTVGRSFFSRSFGEGDLGQGLEYWRGFYPSLRLTQMGLSLNIDTSTRPFLKSEKVIDFVSQVLNTRRIEVEHTEEVKKALEGVIVETTHLDFVYRNKVSTFTDIIVKELSFEKKKRQISVVQHFLEEYGITLEYPFLPAFQFGGKNLKYFPMEVCKIAENQRYTRKLAEKPKDALSRATCQGPDQRKEHINTIVNSYKTDERLGKFGIKVTPEFTEVQARVLPPPLLYSGSTEEESCIEPEGGKWNMTNKKMYNGGTVNYWACVNFSTRDLDEVKDFCENLVIMCCSRGMVFSEKCLDFYTHPYPSQREAEDSLIRLHKRSLRRGIQLQLLIVILPNNCDFYGTIKRVCETKLGFVSQCCKSKNVGISGKAQQSYLNSVALKINVKVGGTNVVLKMAQDGNMPFLTDVDSTIVFGADVTHPPPADKSSSSIAAENRQEIIQDLYKELQDHEKGYFSHAGMIREHLFAFSSSNKGILPGRIIFYRDGVGEGQFKQVRDEEIRAIRKACASIKENYQPLVTFIVVQKRHHTRLFPVPVEGKGRHEIERQYNILPGTVVDAMICHRKEFDFFRCSHEGIKGTSRPIHYHVLLDENKFPANGLQRLTNDLCYMCARCTKSVSVVSPTYYAHLLASRARCYIEDGAKSIPPIMENVKDGMFYC